VAVDENHRVFFVVLFAQLGVGVDIDLAPPEVGLRPCLRERLLDHLGMASAPVIEVADGMHCLG
jgi:hypothetical protein